MTTAAQTQMYREAAQAADAVAAQLAANAGVLRALAAELRASPPSFVVTAARGSSDHAATYAKYLIETRLGWMTASASPSVHSVYAAEPRLGGALYLAISQSGASPDLLRNVEAARRGGARVVALVNVEDSPLAALADTVVPLRAGTESSVAATKSYLCTLSALLQLVACCEPAGGRLPGALDSLPAALRQAWEQDWTPLVEGLAPARNLFVVGRGLGLGAAQEAALKLKETCGLHAEAFSAAEVKHGPMALVGAGFPVLCFAQDDGSLAGTLQVVDEFRGRGARVWLAAPRANGPDALPLAATPDPALAPLVAVQSFYRAANALSLARGYDPDRPPYLNKVTKTV